MLLPLALSLLLSPIPESEPFRLQNEFIAAEFDAAGLTRLVLANSGAALELDHDSCALSVDGQRISMPGVPLAGMRHDGRSITYDYTAGDLHLAVRYELQPGWRFVSKQLQLELPAGSTRRIDTLEVLRARLQTSVARETHASHGTGAVFLRLANEKTDAATSVFFALQNPFLEWERKDGQVALAYKPELEWRAAYGPFLSDRVCIGIQALSGVEFPLHELPEWKYVPEPARAFEGQPALDLAESEAMTRCVGAFALYRPQKSLRVHVPWCENDYQIDVARPEGRAEWKRILDQCAAVGIDHTLFTPANSALAPLSENADAWGWENCLWLGLGQKIRKGEWDIAKDPIPASVQELLDYAKSKGVQLVAYAYPTLGWKQNPEWTAWCEGKTGGYVGADTGVRSFQDWFVDQLVAFQKRTGIGGYSFDHWWIAYEPTKEGAHPTSKYAQWYGCRRILEELRRRVPEIVIDGRQQYQWFGPWTWLAGSYPHPTTNDEQPGSFENFPDLHFSRVSADRQRWAAWSYHMEQFVPLEIVPGYMTHQTPRSDAAGQCVRDRSFQARDWDLLGWRYSVISSIGTAPFNHVVDLLPARDETEFKSFTPEDQRWLRGWMDWTDRQRPLLGKLRPILGPPLLGRIDGSAAFEGAHGVVFLFNPNYRELTAEFALDASIGLVEGAAFALREQYPRPGRLLGKPDGGWWKRGDKLSLAIKGPEALVLELVPASEIALPALLGAPGRAALQGERLELTDVLGEPGQTLELAVRLPAGKKVTQLRVNGRDRTDFRIEAELLRVQIEFAGARFRHCQQIGSYDPGFAGQTLSAQFTIPQRVFDQLAARRKAWPVEYTAEERLATWRACDRLLLFVQIADPNDEWKAELEIDGQPLALEKAYSDVFPLGRERTFTGFYADLSKLEADKAHSIALHLPAGLQPGQFQGLFVENVATELTGELAGR